MERDDNPLDLLGKHAPHERSRQKAHESDAKDFTQMDLEAQIAWAVAEYVKLGFPDGFESQQDVSIESVHPTRVQELSACDDAQEVEALLRDWHVMGHDLTQPI